MCSVSLLQLFIGGQLQESSKNEILRVCSQMDELMDEQKEDGASTLPGSKKMTR